MMIYLTSKALMQLVVGAGFKLTSLLWTPGRQLAECIVHEVLQYKSIIV